MNERVDLERAVARHLASEGASPPSEDLYDELLTRAARSGPRPEWLALIKEPPMRTNSHLAVDSPAARAAAVMVATLLLAVALAAAGVAGQRLLAATGPIIVAQDGSGHYASIAEAVAAAQHGDEILVRPGRYAESVTIDKDITLRGDGPAADVVIERTGDVLIMLQETSAEVANLTLRGDDSTQGMEVMGGAPTVRGVVFDGTGRPFDGGPCPDADACAGLALPGWNRRDGHRQFVPRRWRDHVRFGRQRHLR